MGQLMQVAIRPWAHQVPASAADIVPFLCTKSHARP
jgi:hypothetical protein